jgi:hypothetical protein
MDAKLSVPLPRELRAFVQREAAREDRSEASVVRRLIAREAQRSERAAKTVARDEMQGAA